MLYIYSFTHTVLCTIVILVTGHLLHMHADVTQLLGAWPPMCILLNHAYSNCTTFFSLACVTHAPCSIYIYMQNSNFSHYIPINLHASLVIAARCHSIVGDHRCVHHHFFFYLYIYSLAAKINGVFKLSLACHSS